MNEMCLKCSLAGSLYLCGVYTYLVNISSSILPATPGANENAHRSFSIAGGLPNCLHVWCVFVCVFSFFFFYQR